ncbi:TPA: hypothetical protein JRX02_000148 [Elizabethkingia anophelis]|uniref:hypothetical protein n=1 Tax=Elizabethkingia anophelis TaxID=1117645 RepID=UPI001A2C97C8|nr:hypothetical protein [Elizabethkingia anophelis]HAT3998703.1 hypothetical protein [Elizabethkingia anophelis]HAT4009707.1 hypothetical protein [Elizabethkingia anophelis]HAY3501815.1 hypothetical protein [Elizabethkingia anophelis]HAY3510149.1 hypothetical protein [Elizabethkingia anophelis]
MKFLVISGAPSTGKTTAINKIANWLTSTLKITLDINGNPLPTFLPDSTGKFWDFSVIIIVKGKKIIIHSATDDQYNLDALIEKINLHPDVEIVITSCRDLYWQRDYFINHIKPFSTFFLESPLGKITRRNDFHIVDIWYKNTLLTLHQHILENNPYYL